MTNCEKCHYYIPLEEPDNYLNGQRLCNQCFVLFTLEKADPEVKEFMKKYGKQSKGYLTSKDLAEIKEFIEKDGDVEIEWKFEKEKKE